MIGKIGVLMRQKAVMVRLTESPGRISCTRMGTRLLALMVVLCWLCILNVDLGMCAFGIIAN